MYVMFNQVWWQKMEGISYDHSVDASMHPGKRNVCLEVILLENPQSRWISWLVFCWLFLRRAVLEKSEWTQIGAGESGMVMLKPSNNNKKLGGIRRINKLLFYFSGWPPLFVTATFAATLWVAVIGARGLFGSMPKTGFSSYKYRLVADPLKI